VRILLIEDEERMALLLQQGLSDEGHQIYVARNGADGLATARSVKFDVVILDVMLPMMDGFPVAKHLREGDDQTPLLMLTARDSVADTIKGLDVGAHDYLTKPFSFDLLLARIRAVSRRGPIPRSVYLELADLRLDTTTRRVSRRGQAVSLTPREYSILELLFRNVCRPMSLDAILETVWGFDADVEDNTVEVFVRLLRNKIDNSFEPKLIHTVRGVGYCLRLPES
jgi:two-component system OmpR family response regulator